MQVKQVSSHVYMASGMTDNVNAAFVKTGNGVIVFDTGATAEDGRELRSAVVKATDEPILYVVNSHCHSNHCGGNRAFADSLFLVHRLSNMADLSGTDDSSHTITFSRDCSLCVDGLFIEFRIFSGHSCDSLVMVVPQDNVIVTGDMVFSDGLPSLGNCSLEVWAEELEFLETFNDAVFVPGHGPVADCASVRQQRIYLQSLISTTSSMKRDGLGLDDLEEQSLAELPFVAQCIGKHKENLRTAFLQVA